MPFPFIFFLQTFQNIYSFLTHLPQRLLWQNATFFLIPERISHVRKIHVEHLDFRNRDPSRVICHKEMPSRCWRFCFEPLLLVQKNLKQLVLSYYFSLRLVHKISKKILYIFYRKKLSSYTHFFSVTLNTF